MHKAQLLAAFLVGIFNFDFLGIDLGILRIKTMRKEFGHGVESLCVAIEPTRHGTSKRLKIGGGSGIKGEHESPHPDHYPDHNLACLRVNLACQRVQLRAEILDLGAEILDLVSQCRKGHIVLFGLAERGGFPPALANTTTMSNRRRSSRRNFGEHLEQ